MPSAHMTLDNMPEKIGFDDILKDFKGEYDFLNTVAFDD